MTPDPFAALGLPGRPDLTDEQVRAAWRAIAAATHPDRKDGGDLARYTAATAAYASLRTPWARSEAYADLIERAGPAGPHGPGGRGALDGGGGASVTAPLPVLATAGPPSGSAPRHPLTAVREFPARIQQGRPRRLLIRAVVAAALAVAVLHLIPGTVAAPADIIVLLIWFGLTGRLDLAPPPER